LCEKEKKKIHKKPLKKAKKKAKKKLKKTLTCIKGSKDEEDISEVSNKKF